MNNQTISTRRDRREAARKERDSVSTWHNGQFGVWEWTELTIQEQIEFEMARRRSAYVQTFGVYA
jgi:hypothetical protein